MKYIYKAIFILFSFFLILVSNEKEITELKTIRISVENANSLDSLFISKNYIVDSIFIDSLVPTIFTENIFLSLKEIKVKEKKSLFIRILLPSILKSNNDILKEREFILSVKQKERFTRKEKRKLKKIVKKYSGNIDNLDELLQRVDIVPPSLAIAQAITESGWGTSRYAIQGNALFGHHVSKKDTSDFIKSQNSNVKMKAFNTITEAVEAYMHNINSTRAYRSLRKYRAELRSKNKQITGKDLATHLTKYSIKGVEYTVAIKNMIRQQKLARFDFVKLKEENTISIVRVLE